MTQETAIYLRGTLSVNGDLEIYFNIICLSSNHGWLMTSLGGTLSNMHWADHTPSCAESWLKHWSDKQPKILGLMWFDFRKNVGFEQETIKTQHLVERCNPQSDCGLTKELAYLFRLLGWTVQLSKMGIQKWPDHGSHLLMNLLLISKRNSWASRIRPAV